MVQLLKQKSKIIVAQKPRKKYEPANIFKKPKIDQAVSQEGKDQLNDMLNFSGTGKTAKKVVPKVIEQYENEDPGQTKE